MSGTLTRCRSCGRDTTTTDDWRCTYCGQPKPLTAEPVEPQPEAAAEDPETEAAFEWREEPEARGPRQDLRPQLAAAALAAVIAIVGLLMGSALLLIAAAAVLVIAVVAAIVADGW